MYNTVIKLEIETNLVVKLLRLTFEAAKLYLDEDKHNIKIVTFKSLGLKRYLVIFDILCELINCYIIISFIKFIFQHY